MYKTMEFWRYLFMETKDILLNLLYIFVIVYKSFMVILSLFWNVSAL